MRFDRRLLGWGLFLIVLGAVPLAVRSGVVSEDLASRAWQLWPLLILAIGVSVLARGSALEDAAGLAFPVIFGLMVGGAIGSGSLPFGDCGDEQGSRPFETRTGTFGENAAVDIELGCGELELTAVSGSDWQVRGSDEDGEGPRIESDEAGLRVRADRGVGFFDARARWEIELPTTPRLELEARINAGEGQFVMGGATLGSVGLDVNAGSARLDLSIVNSLNGPISVDVNAGEAIVLLPDLSLTGDLAANAGAIILCTPPGSGIRITTNDNITAQFDFGARGLVRSGNTWETSGFNEAAVRIELSADANAASIVLDRPADCASQPQG